MGHKTREWESGQLCVWERHTKREREHDEKLLHTVAAIKFEPNFCKCFAPVVVLVYCFYSCCCCWNNMWFVVALFVIAAACGVAGRKWGRYLYLHYGRHLLPRSMLTAKNRSPTPPLSPTKDDQSLEALLDESGEMHETVRNPLSTKRRDTRLGLWVEEIMAKFLLKLVIPVMPLVHMLHH